MPKIIGVFGGTFNPVHNGHVQTLSELVKIIPFEKILVIPNFQPPHRENTEVSFEHRYKMTSLAFKDLNEVIVDDRDKIRGGVSYAIETVEEVINEEKKARVVMIVGSDSFAEIKSWYKWRELLRLVDFIVMKRPDMPLFKNKEANDMVSHLNYSEELIKRNKKKNVFEIEVTPFRISSSLIRKNIAKGREVDNFLDPSVKDYLEENHLYVKKDTT